MPLLIVINFRRNVKEWIVWSRITPVLGPDQFASQPTPVGIRAAPTLAALVAKLMAAGTKASGRRFGISQMMAGKIEASAKPISGQ
jgi:hypothetical protein